MEPYVKRTIVKRVGSVSEETEDLLAVEKQIVISVGGREVVRLYCTPTMIKELVVGFLLSEGIIRGHLCAESIAVDVGQDAPIRVDIPTDAETVTEGMVRTSGCVGGMTFERKELRRIADGFSVGADTVRTLYREFNQRSTLFRATGCVHSAAACDGEKILAMAEDIGRHNAVDKVIGQCIIENVAFGDTMVLVSGRLSSEIVTKCARWGVPMLVSRTSPTSYAVDLAEGANMTLIGFVRGERFTIYTSPQRIF